MKFLIINMIERRDEKKRALNIIWNGSNNYSFQPEFKVYDEDGRAVVYFNYIIGAVHKYYDYHELKKFFNYLKIDSDHEFYEQLTWIGLENSTYHKAKKERPVLSKLRMIYSKKVLAGQIPPSEREILNEITRAHYTRVLGDELKVEPRILDILELLEFDEDMNTKEIIQRMNEIIKNYFRFNFGTYEVNIEKAIKSKKASSFEPIQEGIEEESDELGNILMKDLVIESAETTRHVFLEQKEELKNVNLNLHKFMGKNINTDRSYIQKYFGLSILPEHKNNSLEKVLCTGNHNKSKLHFTRGEFDNSFANDANALYIKKVASKQRESNINYYYDNYAKNNNSIINLTNKIRNTMMVNFEASIISSNYGKLAANKIWRTKVNDNNIFIKSSKNDIGNITVDILLDCSASQYERQEVIAAQGYIIAESLTRCQIPVKVYSYCSLRGYTIINLYRDYEESDKNNNIFNYRASGSNRDGLAIRTASHMMENSESEHKILIVLSDCKPFDTEINPGTGIIPQKNQYSGIKGVNDTAYEVKKSIMKGNTVLCVFTGEDEDLPSAKRIYGHNFVRISSLDRFADIVGILLQNQLKNL